MAVSSHHTLQHTVTVIIWCVSLLVCISIHETSCETIYVLASSNSPCPAAQFNADQCITIQEFAANPGQSAGSNLTLVLESGTDHSLNSHLRLSSLHNLTVIASNATATIRCSGGVLEFVSINHLSVSGVTFSGCFGHLSHVGTAATITDSLFLDCGTITFRSLAETVRLVNVYSRSSSAIDINNVTKVVVMNSTFEYGGGHISVRDAPAGVTVEILDSNFHRSTQQGISCRSNIPDTSTMFISRCNFTNNYGAIGSSAFLTIENSSFSDNSIGGYYNQGGAISASYVNITNCYFFRNRANRAAAMTAKGTITDTVFDSNIATQTGGAIFSLELLATRTVFINNRAESRAGAVYAAYGAAQSITFIQCSFINNTARTDTGGAIFFLTTQNVRGNLTLIDSTFSDNSATSCGAVHVSDVHTNHVNITGCTFTRNRATMTVSGGGVACIRNTSVSIQSSEFSHNAAAVHAGVINAEECTISINDCTFFNNSAMYDGGVFYSLVHSSTYIIIQSTFSYNTAGDDGGVIYLGQSGNLAIITASNFTLNSAGDRGGVIALIASTVYIFQSNIMDNSASKGPFVSACNSAVIVPEDITNVTDQDRTMCTLYNGYINHIDIDSISLNPPIQNLPRLIPPRADILSDTIYILASPETVCPGEFSGEPCYTLEQLAANDERENPNSQGNVTVVIENGTHILNSHLTLSNLQSLTVIATSATIRCSGGVLEFVSINHLSVSGVTFSGCSGHLSHVGTAATITDSLFLDCGPILFRSLAETVRLVNVYSRSSSAIDINNVTKVVVMNSTFEYGGGHISVRDVPAGVTVEILDSNFHRSTQQGISCRSNIPDTSTMFISRCNFTNNYGAIGSSAFLTIENSSFSDNSIGGYYNQGGAISASYVNITNCYFFRNRANRAAAMTAKGTITDTVFDSNIATQAGGAIFSLELLATRTVFINNRAESTAGAVYAAYGAARSITFIQCSFINNTARTDTGGAIFFLTTQNVRGNLTLIDSTFSDNSATSCGAVHVSDVHTNHVNITGCTFTRNRATMTGGVACIRNTSVSIQSSEFSHNVAAAHAGVFNIEECNITVEQSIFSNNSAVANGGVMYNNEFSTTYEIQQSIFSHNSAGDDGGVWFIGRAGSVVTFSNSNFSYNDATDRGGVISLVGSSLLINETNMYNNTAGVGETISACSSVVTVYDHVSSNLDPNDPTCTLYDIHIDAYDITSFDEITTTALPTTTEEITTTAPPTTTEEITTTALPTTTEKVMTTALPTTTEEVMTTALPTTTEEITTTTQDSTYHGESESSTSSITD